MNTKNYSVGESLEMLCSACDSQQPHNVESVTKLGKITSVVCTTCGTSSKYSRGVKTSVSLSGSKKASPYDRTRKYKKGQVMLHNMFGQGEVTGVDYQKIDVLFGDTTRRLLHDQNQN